MRSTLYLIRRLAPEDAAAFRELRLFALRESPSAFGSSYEEECDMSVDTVATSLAPGSGRNMFGAFYEDQLVGVVGVARATRLKERHKASIRSMYVAPAHRIHGTGRQLLREAVAFAESQPGIRQITLSVTGGNAAAIALYQSFGFKPFGVEPGSLLVDGELFDEIQMVRLAAATQG